MALGDVIARLSVHLGLETAAFEKGSKRAENRMSGFQKNMQRTSNAVKTAFVGMLGVFAVDQIVQVAKAGLEYASSLGEVASQLGVTTKALQEYRYAASQAGIEQGEMDLALAQLTRRLGDAANGAKEPAKALEALGISVRDANGHVLDAGEAIPLIAEGLKNLQSPAERAAILVDLFGKSGQKLAPLLEGGAAGVNNLRNAAHELGIVLSNKQIQDADETADKLTAMKMVLEAKIAGAVSDNAASILELANALIKLVEAAGKAAKAWRYFSQLDWRPGAGTFTEQFSAMQLRDLGPGVELTDSVKAAVAARRNAPFTAPYGGPLRSAPKRAPAPRGSTPWGPTVQPGLSRAVGGNAFGGMDMSQFTPGQGEGFIRMSQAVKAMVAPLQTVDTLTARINTSVGAQLVRNFQEAANGALSLAGAAQSIMDRLFPEDARRRQYIEDLAILRSQYDGTAVSAARLAEAEARLRNEWIASLPAVDSLRAGLGNYMQWADQAAAKAEESNQRISNSYASMASNVGGLIGQLIGGKAGRIIGGIFNVFGQVAPLFGGARAGGGPVVGGRAYIVGEKGPELMVPGRSGMVIPNHAMPQLVSPPAGSLVAPNGGNGSTTVHIVPTPYFDAVVDGRADRRVAIAAPGIASASASGVQSNIQRSQSRTLA